MENKQTAVDYLFSFFMQTNYDSYINHKAYKIAKKMEKEQIMDAFDESRLTNPMLGFKHVTFKEFYNETYGK